MNRSIEISIGIQRAWDCIVLLASFKGGSGSVLWSCRAKWNIGIVAMLLEDLQKPKCETSVHTSPSVGEASRAGVSMMGIDNRGVTMTGFVELVMVFSLVTDSFRKLGWKALRWQCGALPLSKVPCLTQDIF